MTQPYICVGAVTRRVVEEAAKLNVYQIVASRRQCDCDGGYLRRTQRDLVADVRALTPVTQIVRDHGGPLQGYKEDDGTFSLFADIDAGFDALHLDVSRLPEADHQPALGMLLDVVGDNVVEIGGERDDQAHLNALLHYVLARGHTPAAAVIQGHTKIWNDRQVGMLNLPLDAIELYHEYGVHTKCHNMDWVSPKARTQIPIDLYNVAPELAQVEIDAWLAILCQEDREILLRIAYDSEAWRRWFRPDEGSLWNRARCAVRYVLETDRVRALLYNYRDREEFVRGKIRDAILRG